MTYCVAVALDSGLVFCSDSRTNAGVDQVSTYSKMYRYGIDGQRQFVLLAAGNLATTQGVVSRLKRDIKENTTVNLNTVGSIRDAADYLGEVSRSQQGKHTGGGTTFEASFILGGQIGDGHPQIMLVYPQGNNITSSNDTPFLQIGESKYGKPILDRILTPQMPLDTAALCALVSMDLTMRSNLTVGPPIELLVYEQNSMVLSRYHRFEEDSKFLRELKKTWNLKLKEAFSQLPPLAWSSAWDQAPDGQSGVS